jgi:hypothetical protein
MIYYNGGFLTGFKLIELGGRPGVPAMRDGVRELSSSSRASSRSLHGHVCRPAHSRSPRARHPLRLRAHLTTRRAMLEGGRCTSIGFAIVEPHERLRSSRSSPMPRPLSAMPTRRRRPHESGEIDRP